MVFRASAGRNKAAKEKKRNRLKAQRRRAESVESHLTGVLLPSLKQVCEQAKQIDGTIEKSEILRRLVNSDVFSDSEIVTISRVVSEYGPNSSQMRVEETEAFLEVVEEALRKEGKGGRVKQIQEQADQRRSNRSKDTQARIDRCRAAVSEEMLSFFRRSFEKYDDDHNGVLDRKELRTYLADLDYRVAERELDTMLQVFDADGSDGIDKDEFVTMMAAAVHPPHSQDELLEYFSMLDDVHLKEEEGQATSDPTSDPPGTFFRRQHYETAFHELLLVTPEEDSKYFWSSSALVSGLSKIFFGSGDESDTGAKEDLQSTKRQEYVRKLFEPAEKLKVDISGTILGFSGDETEQAQRAFRHKSFAGGNEEKLVKASTARTYALDPKAKAPATNDGLVPPPGSVSLSPPGAVSSAMPNLEI